MFFIAIILDDEFSIQINLRSAMRYSRRMAADLEFQRLRVIKHECVEFVEARPRQCLAIGFVELVQTFEVPVDVLALAGELHIFERGVEQRFPIGEVTVDELKDPLILYMKNIL